MGTSSLLFFIAGQFSIERMYHHYFLPADGHLGRFQFLALVNKPARDFDGYFLGIIPTLPILSIILQKSQSDSDSQVVDEGMKARCSCQAMWKGTGSTCVLHAPVVSVDVFHLGRMTEYTGVRELLEVIRLV